MDIPDNLKKLPIGNFPTNENQTRYLSQLDSDLQGRWGFKQSQAYRLMDSANVILNLKSPQLGNFQQMKMSTIVDFPTNESQTRYLSQLDSDLLHVRGNIINTFDEYLQGRWNISNVQGYRLINSANVILNLKSPQLGNFQQMKMSTIVDFPTNENQTRYLSQLDSDLLHVRGCSI